MKPKTAPTSPKYSLEKGVSDIWKEGQLQQPARIPWGRVVGIALVTGFIASGVILVALFWFVHAYPGSWLAKAIPSTVTTIVERTTTVNDNGVPKDVLERVANVLLITAQGNQPRYGLGDGRGMAIPISNNGWMLAVQPNLPDGDLLGFRIGAAPQRFSALVRDTASPFAFLKREGPPAAPVSFADVAGFGRQGRVWVAERSVGGLVPVERQLLAELPPTWVSSDRVERFWKIESQTALMPGSPVFDDRGRLFGLVTSENRVADVAALDQALKTVIQRGTLERPASGFRYRMTAEMTELTPAGPAGALIGASNGDAPIVSNGQAEKSGLQSGDTITHVDGREVGGDLFLTFSRFVPGTNLAIRYVRNGESKETSLTLGVLRQ